MMRTPMASSTSLMVWSVTPMNGRACTSPTRDLFSNFLFKRKPSWDLSSRFCFLSQAQSALRTVGVIFFDSMRPPPWWTLAYSRFVPTSTVSSETIWKAMDAARRPVSRRAGRGWNRRSGGFFLPSAKSAMIP